MKSFIEYRKNKLLKSKKLNIQESIVECFDILRLDLLKSMKLPDLLSESTRVKAITESAYEVCKKEDYKDNKQIIELIISEFKNNFWSHLLHEATASVEKTPEITADDLKKQLSDEVDSLVGELKILVSKSLSTTRTTSGDDVGTPDSNKSAVEGSPRSKITSKQADYISDLYRKLGKNPPAELDKLNIDQASRIIDQLRQQLGTGTRGSTPTSFQFNTNQSLGSNSVSGDDDFSLGEPSSSAARSSSGSNQPQIANGRYVLPNDWKSKYGIRYGTERPTYPDGFKPAPYGHMRPSDGWLGGLKRTIWDPMTGWLKNKTRNFRRRWHRDEFREHFIHLENIFLENAVEIGGEIDIWAARLKDVILNKFFDQIKDFASGKLTSLPKTKDTTAGKTGDVSPRQQSPAVDAAGGDDNVEYEDDNKVENPTGDIQSKKSNDATGDSNIQKTDFTEKESISEGASLLRLTYKDDKFYISNSGEELEKSALTKFLIRQLLKIFQKDQKLQDEVWKSKDPKEIDEAEARLNKIIGNSIKKSPSAFELEIINEWLGKFEDIVLTGYSNKKTNFPLILAYFKWYKKEKYGLDIEINQRKPRKTKVDDSRKVAAEKQDLTPEEQQNKKDYEKWKEENPESFKKLIQHYIDTTDKPAERLPHLVSKTAQRDWAAMYDLIRWVDAGKPEEVEPQGSSEEPQGSSEEPQEPQEPQGSSEEPQEPQEPQGSSEEPQAIKFKKKYEKIYSPGELEDLTRILSPDQVNKLLNTSWNTDDDSELNKSAIRGQIERNFLKKKELDREKTSNSPKTISTTSTPTPSNKSEDLKKQIQDELDENKVYHRIYEKYQNYLISKGSKGEDLIDGLDSFDEKIIEDILSKGKDKIEDILSKQESLLDDLIEKIKKDPEPENFDIPEELGSSFEKLERDAQYRGLVKHDGDSLRNQGKDEKSIKRELHEKTLKHAKEMLDQEKTIKQIVQDYEKELGVDSEEDLDKTKSSQSSNSDEEIRRIARSSGEIERISKSGKPIALKTGKKEMDEIIKEIIRDVGSEKGTLVLKDGKIKVKYKVKDTKGRVLKTVIRPLDSLSDKTRRRIKRHKEEIKEFLKPDDGGSVEQKASTKQKEEPSQTIEEIPERLKNIDGYNSLRQEIKKIIDDSNNQLMRNILMRKESEWQDSDLSDEQIIKNLQDLKERFDLQTKKTEGFLGILKRFKELVNS